MATLARTTPRAAPALAGRSRQRVVSVAARKTAAKAATQTYVCIDCGWIYDGSQGPFEKLPGSYKCPVCSSRKSRFRPTEAKGKAAKGAAMRRSTGDGELDEGDKSFFLVAAGGAAVLLGALYFALSSQV